MAERVFFACSAVNKGFMCRKITQAQDFLCKHRYNQIEVGTSQADVMPGYTATVYPPDLQNRKVEALELTESPLFRCLHTKKIFRKKCMSDLQFRSIFT
jgi:hypothetical protein